MNNLKNANLYPNNEKNTKNKCNLKDFLHKNSFFVLKNNIRIEFNYSKIFSLRRVKLKSNSNIEKSKVTWTEEQENAINIRDKNLLISASAGSGKTTVMTQRIVDIIASGEVPITNFLVVTFTSASAQDMKAKIIDKLYALPQTEYILKQIDDVAISDISDLHSFYSRLISTYFYEIQIDPNYHIVDANKATLFKERAISKLFEDLERDGDVEYFRLYDIFQKNRDDSNLKKIIFQLYDFLASHIDGDEWFNKNIDEKYNENINLNSSAKFLLHYLDNSVSDLIDEVEEFLSLCPECEFYNIYFQNILLTLKQFSSEKSFEINLKILFSISFDRFSIPKDSKYEYFKETAKDLNDSLKKKISDLKNLFISDDINLLSNHLRQAKLDLISLYNITKKYEKIYDSLKKEADGLDFNDLERYALKILSNKNICDAVRKKYKYVFVDEYQDINEVQEKIISLISSENNRFMVGDIKQSIYSFRLCDPEIFLSKYKEFSSGGKLNQVIKLNSNFRSDKNILKFVDEIFSRFMTEKFGGINYANDSIFVPGKNNPDNEKSVNLCYIDTQEEEDNSVCSGVYSVENDINNSISVSKGVLEARLVADKIAKILNSENIDTKKVKWSDFAVLFSSRATKNVLEFIDEMKKLNIPISSDKENNLEEKPHVKEIINFAKLCLNENDDICLFNVLKSKLFNFSDNEIVKIRLIDNKEKFFDVIKLYESIDDEKLVLKINSFFEKLNKFKKFAQVMTIKDFCKLVIDEFELENLNLIDIDGKIFNEELEKFLSILPEVSVSGFLNNYDNFSVEGSTESSVDAVQAMTIHKSKGMEFKYVFIINTSGLIPYNKTLNSSILMDKKQMIGINYYDRNSRVEIKTIPMSACKLACKIKIAEEQLRVFYVALTRAKNKLFILCSKKQKELSDKIKNIPQSYSNWFEYLILDKLNNPSNEKYSYINFESYKKEDFYLDENSIEQRQFMLTKQNIPAIPEFQYEYLDSLKIPLKNSVSKILKLNKEKFEQDDFDDKFEIQESELSNEYLISSANRGTSYHKFFQNVDFSLYENIFLQFNDILEKFSEQEKKYIDLNICKKVLSNQFFKDIEKMVIFKEREFFAEMPANIINKNSNIDDKIIMQGVIDLCAVSDDEIYVLDYKTGKCTQDKLEKYKFQLNIYSDICEKALGRPVTRKLLCFIDELKFVEI